MGYKLKNRNWGLGLGMGLGIVSSLRNFLDAAVFMTTWDTTQTGVSASNQIQIPFNTGTNNFDWETSDGQTGTHTVTTDLIITFTAGGNYTLKIGGTNNQLTGFRFNGGGDRRKLTMINNWGDPQWQSGSGAFSGCLNMDISAVDAPDLSIITNMFSFFANCSSISSLFWSGVSAPICTTLSGFLDGCSSITQAIVPDLCTPTCTLLQNAFKSCVLLTTVDTSNWDTANVENMERIGFNSTLLDMKIDHLSFASLTNATEAMDGSAFSTVSYDLFLVSADAQVVQSSVPFHAGGACYSAGGPEASRDNLIIQDFWTFTDGGPCANANFWEGTIDAVYSKGGNWSLGTVPTNTEVALFIGGFNNPCDIDVNADVEGIELQLGYTSTITQLSGNTLAIGVASIYMNDGNFVGGDSAINNAGYHANHAGSFTSTSDVYTLSAGNFVDTATFVHNSGQVIFTGNNQQISGDGIVFNKVKNINGNPASGFTVNDNISVITEYFHDRGVLKILSGKTISLQGDWVAGSEPRLSAANGGAVEFNGTGAQELYNDKAGGLARIPAIRVNKSAGTLTMFDQVQFSAIGDVVGLEYVQGSVSFDASFVSIKSVGNGYFLNWPVTAPLIPLMEQDQGNSNTGMTLGTDFKCAEFNGLDGRVFFTGFNFETVGNFTHRNDLRGGTNDVLTVGGIFDWADGTASAIVGQWFLNVAGNAFAHNVNVQDCNANGGNTVIASNSVDSLNNDNWDFSNSLVTNANLDQATNADLDNIYT